MLPSTISCGYMLSFTSPTSQTSMLSSWRQERSLARLAARIAACSKASVILPRLYLSNYRIASDEDELEELGITHVVSVLENPPQWSESKHIKTLHISIEDTAQSNLLEHLQTTTDFIKQALEENDTNKVLVHCMMGISRSATVVCAYLVATTPMTAAEAIEFVAERRSIVNPNPGFLEQLETYAMRFGNKCSKPKPEKPTAKAKSRSTNELADKIRRLAGLKGLHTSRSAVEKVVRPEVVISAT